MRIQGENAAKTSRHAAWTADSRIFEALGISERSSAHRAGLLRTALDDGERARAWPETQPTTEQNAPRQDVIRWRSKSSHKLSNRPAAARCCLIRQRQTERGYFLGCASAIIPLRHSFHHAALRAREALSRVPLVERQHLAVCHDLTAITNTSR